MLKKIYSYSVDFYSGFKASETNYYEFNSLSEAYKSYKNSKKYDFAYDDGTYYSTKRIRSSFVFVKDEQQHHHDSRHLIEMTKIYAETPMEIVETNVNISIEEYIFDKDEYIF